MDTKWTPGEWYAPEPDDNPSAIKSDQGHRAVYVADVLDPRDRSLIAAAPMLAEGAQDALDALHLIRRWLKSGKATEAIPDTIEVVDTHIDELSYALARARGETA